jgi:undecaprenyl diphosphate synthase
MPVITKRVIGTYDQPSALVTPGVSARGVVVPAGVSQNAAAISVADGDGLLPAHVAIIMDGNGRWAKSRGLPRVAGHREGAKAVRRTIEAAIRSEVAWLTIYAFSSENWRRPPGEIPT